MSNFLFGGEKSGTPIETRNQTSTLANMFASHLASGGPTGLSREFGRMTNDAWVNMLGFNPAELGLDEASISALQEPRDVVSGLSEAMMPFEARETERQTAGLRQMFGAMGGRFGSGALRGETELRGELASQFGRNRENAFFQAEGLRNQAVGLRNDALANLLAAATAARGQAFNEQILPFQSMLGFLQPGAPVIQEGALPGIISAGMNLYGLMQMNKGRGGGSNFPNPVGQTVPTDTRGRGGQPLPFVFPYG